jgi:hypothetical protein
VNEKMKILKMLEEGRITTEEASRLLDTVADSASPPAAPHTGPGGFPPPRAAQPSAPSPFPPSPPPYPAAPPPPPRAPYGPVSNDGGYRRAEPSAPRRSGDSVAEDLSKRFENFFRDLEPKIQRFTETVVEKTSDAADALSKRFQEPLPRPGAYPPPPGPARPARPPAPQPARSPSAPALKGRNERDFEQRVTENGSELILEGLNGQVLLKGYNGDKITAKVYYTPKRGNPPMELMALGSKYYLSYDENEFESVSIDAYIPETLFDNIRVTTNNGHMVIQTVRTTNARFESSGGDVEVSGFSAKDLLIENSNGNLRLTNVTAERAAIDDFNGAINAQDTELGQLKMSTFNGDISMRVSRFSGYDEYMWAVDSNNGKVSMVLPSSISIGYHIRANATLSEVKIGLTGLSYITNSKSNAEAESTNFDQAEKKVTLLLETSNAPLVVN